ncbi:helix-turn-helix domain-containing protein [Saccharibacillus kuerlensis]|uniref:DNA-binding response regulator n=1 Tax=Saccharibacillus kuerlensis TaxID=459527 RepID=A0ABQ2L749_9BACL|nr:response regulator [Saccharibacillus kuerlensis]GGO02753.1 hypothetical protein GCM10010969_26350 [Saccharibacillus kuerlensis]
MLNVLIVDDDKLVRRGLISAMPWSEFGLQVAGEARNGEKALEFLETHEVDLMLTDLAMPVMSGLELMRTVRIRYPRIFIVVLTLHQDFSYIQEALRLGAIDYIAKVQLEEERFEEVLERICSRIDSERRRESSPGHVPTLADADGGYALIGSIKTEIHTAAEQLPAALRRPDLTVTPDLHVWMDSQEPNNGLLEETLSDLSHRTRCGGLIRLSGLRGRSVSDISARLEEYLSGEWFYVQRPDIRLYTFDLSKPDPLARESASENIQRALADLRKRGAKSDWLHESHEFESLLVDLASLRLPPQRLHGELLGLTYVWNAIYEAASGSRLETPEQAQSWFEAEQEIRSMRELLRTVLGLQLYSHEVRSSIMLAAALVRERLSEPLQAGQIAREVNMSRSYFSQCFRDMLGVTFNEYVRQQRIARACTLLAETRKTVQWVAERTGYADEKYFSRIFREQTGMLPSEYRHRYLQEETNVR